MTGAKAEKDALLAHKKNKGAMRAAPPSQKGGGDADVKSNLQLARERLAQIAAQNKISALETSVKDNLNTNKALDLLLNTLLEGVTDPPRSRKSRIEERNREKLAPEADEDRRGRRLLPCDSHRHNRRHALLDSRDWGYAASDTTKTQRQSLRQGALFLFQFLPTTNSICVKESRRFSDQALLLRQ